MEIPKLPWLLPKQKVALHKLIGGPTAKDNAHTNTENGEVEVVLT